MADAAVIVVDAGEPRNAPAAHMHSYLGHEGISPAELSSIGREEVRSYGGEVLSGRVLDVKRTDNDRFRLDLVGRHTNVDFRAYKPTTILRRIARRMAVTRTKPPAEDRDPLQQTPPETPEPGAASPIEAPELRADPGAQGLPRAHGTARSARTRWSR